MLLYFMENEPLRAYIYKREHYHVHILIYIKENLCLFMGITRVSKIEHNNMRWGTGETLNDNML
jgi:hypothetical protein